MQLGIAKGASDAACGMAPCDLAAVQARVALARPGEVVGCQGRGRWLVGWLIGWLDEAMVVKLVAETGW